MFFEKKVNTRKRQSMIDFLVGHFRYNTMSSSNGLSSYANRVKLRYLGLTSAQITKAYDVLSTDFWDEIDYPIDAFTREMDGRYTISSNGRSSGYLVLMNSRYELTGHKSHCRSCGQRNYKFATDLSTQTVKDVIMREVISNGGFWTPETYLGQSAVQSIEISDNEKLAIIREAKDMAKESTVGNKCGRCGADGDKGRVNYVTSPRRMSVTGMAIDQGEAFDNKDEWSMQALRERVELVQRFDHACDEIRDNFIALLDNCNVVEETIMVPKTRKVLQCSEGGVQC